MRTPSPETLARMHGLELRARRAADGFRAGEHAAHGVGAVGGFAQHRPYAPGDDPRRIDWKAFGRTERLLLKQHDRETEQTVRLRVDASASMGYGTKFDFAAICAAALSLITVRQGDRIGLTTFDRQVRHEFPATARLDAFPAIIRMLAEETPSGTSSAPPTSRERGIEVIISDCLLDVSEWADALRRLRFSGREVLLLRVLDSREIEFPFTDPTRFRDLETFDERECDPQSLGMAYREAFAEHAAGIAESCRTFGVRYAVARTDEEPSRALGRFLRGAAE